MDVEAGPLRRCVVTRQRLPKERMIRFVLGPDRQLVPDLAANLPGRGMWLSASGDVLQSDASDEAALRNLTRAFARAARGAVTVPADLSVLVQATLVRRITERVGLARRAGQAVAGYEKARDLLQTGRAGLLLQASDGSMAEKQRIRSGLRQTIEVIDPLPGAVLGRVFGRDYLVHVAIAPGKLADSLVQETSRLNGLTMRSARATPPEGETAPANHEMGVNG